MQIETTDNTVTITGNIKSIQDYQEIKNTLDGLISKNKQIVLDIKDSISIISSVIGYLNKLVLKDQVDLHIKVGDPQLYELFDELSLIELFKVKKA